MIGAKANSLALSESIQVVHDNLGYALTEINDLDVYYDRIIFVNSNPSLSFTPAQQAALDAFSGTSHFLDNTLTDAAIEAKVEEVMLNNAVS
ncbi:MAG: hypothetical protein AAF331_13135, partial [Pseudomonadota bacterium]